MRCADEGISTIAAREIKEARYHLRHSRLWLLRLGDGTAESHARVQEASGAILQIGPRESFVTAPGVTHWHGAMPNEPLTQVSLSFGATNWMEKVSDAQYTGKGK